MNEQWYNLGPDEALQALESRRSGLTAAEARERLLRYGPNRLQGKKKTPPLLVFLRQFLNGDQLPFSHTPPTPYSRYTPRTHYTQRALRAR